MSVLDRLTPTALRQHGCITSGQLADIGLTRHEIRGLLRSGVLVRVTRGVYALVGARSGWARNLMALTLAAGPQALASHRSAAALLGLDGYRPGHLEVVSARGLRTRIGRSHETLDLPGRDREVVDGIPTTSATRTIIDMGRYLGPVRLGRMADDAVRRGLASYEGLHERLRELARRGRPGIVVARAMLAERPGGAPAPGSDFETMTRRLLIGAGLPAPVLQHPVEAGEYRFLLDLAWPSLLVAVECEGFKYHCTPDQLAWDEFRRNQLLLLGWLVLTFTWITVRDRSEAVVAEVRRAIETRQTRNMRQ